MKKEGLVKSSVLTGTIGWAIIAVIAGVFTGCGHRAFQSGPQDPGMHAEWLSKKIADRLDLTTDQKARLAEFVSDLHEKRKEGRAWRQSMRQGVSSLVRQERIGRNDIDRLVDLHRQRMDKVICIPEDTRPYMFEPFYRADNSALVKPMVTVWG